MNKREHLLGAVGDLASAPSCAQPLTSADDRAQGAVNGQAATIASLLTVDSDAACGITTVILPVPAYDVAHSLAWWKTQAALQLDDLLITLGRRRTKATEILHTPGLVVARVSTRRA